METNTENSKINTELEKQDRYAGELLRLAKDTITVRFRFFDAALGRLKTTLKRGLGGVATNGDEMFFDPVFILREYLEEPHVAVRAYLHMLLHCIFFHQFQYDKLNENYWNLATDIAVENIILDLDFPAASLARDSEEIDKLYRLKKRVKSLTAEKLYREFAVNGISYEYEMELKRLFTVDFHDGWRSGETEEVLAISEEEWKKITKRIQTELKAFSKDSRGSESLEAELAEATRERYDYESILEKFTVSGETVTINDDEFDYVYYTYGLATYGNMPLIEPLEYREEKKVREFVIAIDTSASCRGEIVREFVRKTYDILKGTESFFREVNVHIIQCDSQIQSDTKLKNDDDFKLFIEKGEIRGFGGTDFRPVFSYVDELIEKGEFENLKGLIYFTDGYGVYPEKMPKYDVIFAFLNEDVNRQPVPDWAIKVILEEDQL
jgi:predicted metal-dependent peptidase